MKKSPLRISAVSYINAKPFVYGIERSGFLKNYSLSLDIPSVCAEKLISKKADIGLAPIAVIPKLKDYFIIPDFCIGADGPVRSVMLYSEVPLKKIRKIFLDGQSGTSVLLVQILAKHFWKTSPQWLEARPGYEKRIEGRTAGLIIGDRNFTLDRKFAFSYDLAEQWKLFTGLPFVFACWITNKELEEQEAMAFYKSLRFGLENRDKVVKTLKGTFGEKPMKEYLNQYISYTFDLQKRTAMDLFLRLSTKIAMK